MKTYGISETEQAAICHRFTYHKPKDDQGERYEALRAKARELALLVAALTPVCREQSLALTRAEEAVFWANAAIARNEP